MPTLNNGLSPITLWKFAISYKARKDVRTPSKMLATSTAIETALSCHQSARASG